MTRPSEKPGNRVATFPASDKNLPWEQTGIIQLDLLSVCSGKSKTSAALPTFCGMLVPQNYVGVSLETKRKKVAHCCHPVATSGNSEAPSLCEGAAITYSRIFAIPG